MALSDTVNTQLFLTFNPLVLVPKAEFLNGPVKMEVMESPWKPFLGNYFMNAGALMVPRKLPEHNPVQLSGVRDGVGYPIPAMSFKFIGEGRA